MDQKTLNQIKEQLEQEKQRLEQELASFAEKNSHSQDDYHAQYPNFGSESDENAQEVATFDDRLTLERTLEKELQDVNGALKRIKDGTYGICKYCGQEIAKERLLARPTSSACIRCKKKFKGEA